MCLFNKWILFRNNQTPLNIVFKVNSSILPFTVYCINTFYAHSLRFFSFII